MKNLRLIILPLLLTGFLSVSCNEDDDSSGNNVDMIVGTWKVTDAWVDGESVYDQLLLVAYCPLQNEYNFLNDYTLSIDTFEDGNEAGECVAGEVQNGTWTKTNDVYSVNLNGETSSSTANFLDENNFTTETTFEGQAVTLKFTRQ